MQSMCYKDFQKIWEIMIVSEKYYCQQKQESCSYMKRKKEVNSTKRDGVVEYVIQHIVTSAQWGIVYSQ